MSPLVLLTAGEILVFTPVLALAAWFCWRLYRQDRAKLATQRIAELEQLIAELKRLPPGATSGPNGTALALAAMVSAAAIASVLLAIPTVFFIAGHTSPLAGSLILVAIDILLPSVVSVAAYLWWPERPAWLRR